jgi:hypothetical protein
MADLEWRAVGSPDWNVVMDVQSPFTLVGLSACLNYEARIIGHCNGSDSAPSQVLEFTADGCCRIPTGLYLISASNISAIVAWDSVGFAFAHHVRFKETDSTEWTEITVMTNLAALQDLTPCTVYEVQVGSQCDLDSTEYSESFHFHTGACASCITLPYCESEGDDATAEWIDSISLGSLRLQTGNNNGYLFHNNGETGLERKRTYEFHVKPAAAFPDGEFFLRMWIDLNQDGVFTDSTELLVDPLDPVTQLGWTQTIVIADSVPLGSTRMRVALKAIIDQDTIRPQSCGNFLFGEVEDYCISIDDVCPEVVPVLVSSTETSATIAWQTVSEAIVFVFQYRDADGGNFGEEELTQDSLIVIDGLQKCSTYILRVLSVCVQDTSSWLEFEFETKCPNAVDNIIPLADRFIAYPNPFNEQVSVSMIPQISGSARLRLFDLMGRELFVRTLRLTPDEEQVIELTQLSALHHGVYLLVLEADGRTQVLKLVK